MRSLQTEGLSDPRGGCPANRRAIGCHAHATVCIASSSGLMLAIG
jgi:hypothetical protein